MPSTLLPTATSTIRTKRKTRSKITNRFYRAPLRLTTHGGAFTLPRAALDELGVKVGRGESPSIYWYLLNGVLQVSAHEPNLTIPVAHLRVADFVKQNAGD